MQRYEISIQQPWNTHATEHGEWVKFTDAQTTIARLTAELSQAREEASAAAIEMRERAANEACYACGSQDIIRILPLHDTATSLAEMLDAETRACAQVALDYWWMGYDRTTPHQIILARIDQRKEKGE